MAKRGTWISRFLNITEKVGNALPHPATLFAIFALMTILFSGLAYWVGWSAIHPGTGEAVLVVNLLSNDGFHRILLELVDNFTGFAPLGIVLVAMLGIGVAEGSGLIGAVIRLLVLSAPKKMLTFVLVFSGIVSNTAADVGYVLLIPLAGIIFKAIGRHPITGMAAAFAGVSGGFSANLLLGTVDPLLAGLSQEAAQIVDPAYLVNPTANFYFMVVSTFLIAIVGTVVTERIVAPRMGDYSDGSNEDKIEPLSRKEKKGLLWAGISTMLITVLILAGLIPENGFLRGPDGTILQSPVIRAVVAWLFIFSFVGGVIYGIATGKFSNDSDVANSMADSMKTLAIYWSLSFLPHSSWPTLNGVISD